MVGMLDWLTARAQPGGFPAFTAEPTPDPDVVDAAEVAARRQRRGVKHWSATELQAGGEIPGIGLLGQAGMLGTPDQFNVDDNAAAREAGSSLPPTTNDPASGEPVVFAGGVPLPRPRPSDAPQAPAQADDVSSANMAPPAPLSIAPQAPAAAGAPAEAGGIGGILSRLLHPNNAPLLLSLAGGFAGAPSVGTGMRRAFSGAAPAAMQLQAQNTKQASQGATLRALMARGVPQNEAIAAVLDPNLMKALSAKYFETKARVPHKIGVDMMGNDIMGSFDPNSGKFYNASNQEISSGGGAGVADTMLAKGITEINQELPAEEYKAQFSPQVQAQIDNYIRGDTMPTGNPRLKGSAGKVKEWAQLYGSKAGIPVSDAAFGERQTHRREMASGKAGVGMQRTALRQGLEHLESLSGKANEVGNVDLWVGPLTNMVNSARGLTTNQRAKVTALQNDVQMFAGEMGKFFSGSQGGGVHEREATRQKFNAVSSPQELAAAIESSLELLHGGLHAREQAQQQLFGGKVDPSIAYLTDADRKRVDRIEQLVKKLRGEGGGAAAPAGKTSSGLQWSIVQ